MQVFGKYGLGLSIAALIFFPSLVILFGQASSFAFGLISAVLVIYLIFLVLISFNSLSAFFSWSRLLQLTLVIAMILVHFYCSRYLFSSTQDSIKMFGTLVCLTLFSPAAYIVANSLVKIKQCALRSIFKYIFLILILNAILMITKVNYFSIQSNKPAFLFSEPSHFALISAPFLMYYVRSRLVGWKLTLLIYGLSSVYIENLTMLVVFMFTLFVSFNLRRLLLLLPFFIIIFLAFANIDYFYNRLIYSPDNTDNISLLVVLQGWQNAYLAFANTFGLGVGFQQFGIASDSGEITKRLIELSGISLNLFDGGSTAAKLIGEFGVFGAVLVFALIYRAINAYKVLHNGKVMSDLFVFSRCVEITILIELFVRGVGYFSPGIFLYLIVLYVSYLNKKISSLMCAVYKPCMTQVIT
jgi:hypothetical protein